MKALVIYFSRADENYFGGTLKYIDKGNTEVVAEYIRDICGADLFKVERKVPYSADYMQCIQEAKEEANAGKLPEIKERLKAIDGYSVIFIGAPVYWGTMPRPMFTQLESLDFSGKTVMPFVTHEGSGLASVVSDIRKIARGADVKEGLPIVGSRVGSAKKEVEKWIKDNIE